jgi:hypothetical protein
VTGERKCWKRFLSRIFDREGNRGKYQAQ